MEIYKKVMLFSVAFVFGIVGSVWGDSETLLFKPGQSNKFVNSYSGTSTVPLSAEIEDSEAVADGEVATTKYGTQKTSPVTIRASGDRMTVMLLRFDLSSLEELRNQIEGGRLVLKYKFASNNLPTMELYRVSQQAGEWEPKNVTWKNFFGKKAPTAQADTKPTSLGQKLGEMKVAGAGGKIRTAEFEIPASLLSEGTIKVIALVIALYFENKRVMAFEEPAISLHPKLISQLMQMMKEVSEEKQIFVTTHNPEVIRHVELENLYLVSRDEDGFSKITKPGDSEIVHSFLENELGIDDLFVDDLLSL